MRAWQLLAIAWVTVTAPAAAAATPHRRVAHAKASLATFDPEATSAPSYRYANLSREACLGELTERQIEYLAVADAPGVLAPVRIPNGVGGVRYHTQLPAPERTSSPWEVFDCRLVLALADFSTILKAHGYDEAIIFSGWRPPGKRWPQNKLADRHPGGLAVDVKQLRKSSAPDGSETLDITANYHGSIGSPSCGPTAQLPNPPEPKATELRAIYCEAVAARIFTSMLSPNHNRAHFNHFHLEVTPIVTWRLIR